jgi:hypothetical protein
MSKTDKPKSWRDVLPVHPAADLFPMMSPDELKALGDDIKKYGLCVVVTLWQAEVGAPVQLIDGRNRLDASEAAGISVLNRQGDELDCRLCNWARPGSDPYELVLTLNMHRRHLTPEQKRDVIAKLIKAQPEKSNRQIAKLVKADDKTVGAVRAKLEARAEIPHVSTTTDTKGRKQPTRKTRRSDFSAAKERKAAATAAADRAEERSQQAKRIEKCVQNAAHAVETEQSDIERVLPDADRLVVEILERDKIVPGYAKAVMVGIAARLEVSGYPDMPDMLRRKPTIAPDVRT